MIFMKSIKLMWFLRLRKRKLSLNELESSHTFLYYAQLCWFRANLFYINIFNVLFVRYTYICAL